MKALRGLSLRVLGLILAAAEGAQAALLSVADVQRIAAQGEQAAEKLGQTRFTIAVTDRVGNVLAVYRRGEASAVTIDGRTGATGGLDKVSSAATGLDLAAFAAISKAMASAYLSSNGNAFSTRSSSFVVQNHFPPSVRNSASGPLYGVQFSQLPCGDLVQTADPGSRTTIGPRRAPLGLGADPGGFPLYKDGDLVGAVGVMAGAASTYSLDPNPPQARPELEERIAQAAQRHFEPPAIIRGDQITVGGFTVKYSAADGSVPAVNRRVPVRAVPISVPGYTSATVKAGRAYGTPGSGIVRATLDNSPAPLVQRNATVLVDENGVPRYPPRAGLVPPTLTAAYVTEILQQSLGVANEARTQVRKPLQQSAQVNVVVVDAAGNILGIARTPDALVDGIDATLQKARAAAFFSRKDASAQLRAVQPTSIAGIVIPGGGVRMDAARALFGRDVFTGFAFSTRSIANIHRPNFPDGIDSRGPGPLSNGRDWSLFNVGLQLDLVLKNVITALAAPTVQLGRCTATEMGISSGIQIFAGAVPIYAGNTLVGAVGASGDGSDQSDLVVFLGLQRASEGKVIRGAVGQAPVHLRAERFGLRYVSCPQSPFLNSSQQNVCAGF